MKENMIPFDLELFRKGYKVVTRDGREPAKMDLYTPEYLEGYVNGNRLVWYNSGLYSILHKDHHLDLFLIEPDR
jgi:hypothetical protein